MFKLLYTSSEEQNNFGVSKVVSSLNAKLQEKKIKSIFSNNVLKLLLFKPDLIHINGCWKIRLILFFIFSKILRIKIIISPHGMMDPASLNQKSLKKKIALFLYQKTIFRNSDLIIVNSKIEKKNFLGIIKKVPNIVIIPHGVNIDEKFRIKNNKNKDLKFVFFSRIHKSKNLDTLIKLWKSDCFFEKLNLDIYGEILDRKYFSSLNISYVKNINYMGPLNNNIQQILSKYDVLIHPSKSENFGLVIFEGLSSGLFLILNKSLEKKFLEKNNFAKNINFNSVELKNAIKKIMKNKRKIKSYFYKRNTLNYIKKNFDWKKISSIYVKNYKELLHK